MSITENPGWLPASEGWMHPHEMAILNSLAMRGGNVLEIGVWKGRGTSALTNSPATVFCVDPFTGNTGEAWGDTTNTKDRFMANMAKLGRTNWSLSSKTSDDFFKGLPKDTYFRTIVIDGLHTDRQVFRDLFYSWQCLEVGGVIFVDDIWRPSVQRGVANFLQLHPEASVSSNIDFHGFRKMLPAKSGLIMGKLSL